MQKSDLLWEGKSQKCHFFVDDFWGIVLALCAVGMQLYIVKEWKGESVEYLMCLFLALIICYESIGKFIIRFYYVKNVYYKLHLDKLVIGIKIGNSKYLREFYIKDITSVVVKKYKNGLGSIHFGDAETKYWDKWDGQYKGFKQNIVVTNIGLWRKKDKWNSGIIYSIEQVDKVYNMLEVLRQNCKEKD